MSEWKISAKKRRYERQGATQDEASPHKAKPGRKTIIVMCKLKDGETSYFNEDSEWRVYRKYSKRGDAESAITAIENKPYYCKFEYKINQSS